MENKYHYATVSEAIDILRKEGYNLDFTIEDGHLCCHDNRFDENSFEIKEVYRYEGDTDPADEATVYGIESSNGKKGIFVTAYGAYTSPDSEKILRKFTL